MKIARQLADRATDQAAMVLAGHCLVDIRRFAIALRCFPPSRLKIPV
jgi:hypothetical protein